MKKIFLPLCLIALALTQYANGQTATPATPAQVKPNAAMQQGKPPMNMSEERAKRQTEMMAKELNLTDEEKTKVQAINLKYAKKQDDMTNMMQQMRKDQDSDLKSTLTADQYKTYTEKRMPPRAGMNPPHPSAPPATPAAPKQN